MHWELLNNQLFTINVSQQRLDELNSVDHVVNHLDNTFHLQAQYSFATSHGFFGLGHNRQRCSGRKLQSR